MWLWSFLACLLLSSGRTVSASTYLIGLGSYDITGPAADVNMMGYANTEQNYFRGSLQLVTIKVLERLKSKVCNWYSVSIDIQELASEYGDLYNEQNVAISGTHTHAGPGGYLQYVLRQSFIAMLISHHDFTGELVDAGVNRSPSAYLNNPETERKKYNYNVDKEMTLLKFVDDEWGPIGSFNWFATHGTSMSRTNSLISGDNKGAAARFMEDWYEKNSFENDFGGKGLMELASSFQSSPGKPTQQKFQVLQEGYPDEFESTRIIGERQFRKAVEIFNTASEQLKGKVGFQHAYVDFSNLDVTIPKAGGDYETVKTCPAAMGFAFAAGTTDGPGAFDFTQGDDKGNAFWKLVRNILKTPNEEQIKCQHPKPILLDTGEMNEPYDWAWNGIPPHPKCSPLLHILDTSNPRYFQFKILRIGQLVILSVPGEFTTMAGRRLRDAVQTALTSGSNGEFDSNVHVVIAGLTNTYSQYVTTFEEYQVQRYEGASTLYGPHTLDAYIQEFRKLAAALLGGQAVEAGPQPPDLLDKQISLLIPRGDTVTVTFWTACPRNDLMTEGTYALVEILQGEDEWIPAYDDDDFCLRFKWSRPAKLSPRSYATIEWRIPDSAVSGVYRIRHFGASKGFLGSIHHFTVHTTPSLNLHRALHFRARMFHFNSEVLMSPCMHSTLFRAISWSKKFGGLIFFDLNLPLPLWKSRDETWEVIKKAWEQADIIEVTKQELEFLLDEDYYERRRNYRPQYYAENYEQTKNRRDYYHYTPKEISPLWHDRLKLLFVTDGTLRIHYYAPSFDGVVIGTEDVLITPFTCDRTGSGDAVVAGIMRKLTTQPEMYENQDFLERQLRFAIAAGIISQWTIGAVRGFPTESATQNLKEQVYVPSMW
ncbi:fructokinase-like 1 [Actinidia rufa]|uniref:Neutral ceramidase n=1 Tax=Actinidia rufa TaxID=165716 RepID=A0A7J0EBD9_9ERIC|nr:fructokinase-like 1 [Actinidia rufa]